MHAPTSSPAPDIVFGCGYLGARVAELWRRQGRTVVAVTRSPQRGEEFARLGLVPHVADICEPETLRHLPEADTVLFAVGFDRRVNRTQEEVVVDGLRNALAAVGSRCRRWIFTSSTSVYGQQDGSWVDETSPTEPTQPGGICCLAAETLLGEFFQTAASGSAVVLRLAGLYGPDRLLSRIEDLKAGIPLSGRPEAWLNLIHVEDAAQAVIAAANVPLSNGRERKSDLYLVADDRPVARGEYYARLAELCSAPPPQFDPHLPGRRGSGGLNKRCSNRRLKEELRLALRYPTFDTGLSAALGIES